MCGDALRLHLYLGVLSTVDMYSRALLALACLVSVTTASSRQQGANILRPGAATFDVPWPTWPDSVAEQAPLDIAQGTVNTTIWKPAVQEQNFNDGFRSNWSTIGYHLSADPDSYAVVAVWGHFSNACLRRLILLC